jgi:hypothetical protein
MSFAIHEVRSKLTEHTEGKAQMRNADRDSITWLVLLSTVTCAALIAGCAGSFSSKEHQPYSAEGSATIEGEITGAGKGSVIYLHPATSYGKNRIERGIMPVDGEGTKPGYHDLVRRAEIVDSVFSFRDLPAGKYRLMGTVTMELSQEEFVQQCQSTMVQFTLVADESISYKTALGALTRREGGPWMLNGEPVPDIVTLDKYIGKLFTIGDGEHKKIVLSTGR